MQLFIGETIKRLRQQKGITQETLAEYMHVTTAAVSKWERNETLPDISMVIPLASSFGVSTDEILGLDQVKNEKAIQAYLEENQHLAAQGKAHERFDLISRAHGEFPNDWRIVEAYMWQLNYDPNCTEPYGNEVHKDELYRLCHRVLNECPADQTRYAALSILGGLHLLDGDKEKALETARRFPDYWMTSGEEIEHCFPAKAEDNTPWLAQLRENIWDLTSLLQAKIRNAALHAKELDRREQIKCFEQAVTLIKIVFDEGDYGFFHRDLSDLYLWIANRYVMIHEPDLAFPYYELGFRHAKAYDDLPEITTHTSFLVRGKIFDKSKIFSDVEANMVKWQADCLRSWAIYEKVKDTPQMKVLLAKYEPLMTDKKEYS